MSETDFSSAMSFANTEAVNGFSGGGDGERVLNQDEINSLFGDVDEPVTQGGSGLSRLIGAPRVSYERLPMLDVVFDRFVRFLTTSARNFTSDNVDVALEQMGSQRFGDYLDSVSGHSVFAIFKAVEWDNYGVLVLNSSLVFAIVDALLGGHSRDRSGRSEAHGRLAEGRTHTTIEQALISPLISIVLRDLAEAFSPLCAINFRFERLELNPRFAAISRSANGVVMARFNIDMAGDGGDLDVILPHATLEPVRDVLLQQFMGEKFGHDDIWETHLAREVWQTDVGLDAVLAEQTMSLQRILSLAPGDQLVFRHGQRGGVQVRCGDKLLFHARVGRSHGHVAFKIEEKVSRTERNKHQSNSQG